MPKNDEHKSVRCSFCGKHQEQVSRIIAGPGAYICNECVQLCMSILDEAGDEPIEDRADIPDVIPTPREIRDVLDEYIIGQEPAKVGLVRVRRGRRDGGGALPSGCGSRGRRLDGSSL